MAMGSCPSPCTYTIPWEGNVCSEAALELVAVVEVDVEEEEEEENSGKFELVSEYSQSLTATSRICCRYLKKRLSLLSPCNIA